VDFRLHLDSELTLDSSPEIVKCLPPNLPRCSPAGDARRAGVVRAWLRAGGPLVPDISATPVLFADAVRRGQEQGDVPSAVDAVRSGHVVFDAFLGALYRWVGDDGSPGLTPGPPPRLGGCRQRAVGDLAGQRRAAPGSATRRGGAEGSWVRWGWGTWLG
jgi:hypothetical protein